MRRLIPAVSLALLLVLAGCAGLGDTGTDTAAPGENTTVPDAGTEAPATDDQTEAPPTDQQTTEATSPDDSTDTAPPDPEEDVLGWEQGYWYNESLNIDQSDGLNQSELEKVTARQMAMVEKIRQLEFTDDVSVEVISREEYAEQNTFTFSYGEWYQTYYEAAFLVGEDTDVNEEFDALYGSSVAGYYNPRQEAIVLVSDNPDAVRVDPTTLAHELVHALQDDALPRTRVTAVSEGDANYVMDRYEQRCETDWDCIENNAAGPGDRPDINFGLYATIWLPYSDGPTLIDEVYQRGGWEAVNDLYENPPTTAEQVIHPEKYPDEEAVDVSVRDRSSADWEVASSQYGQTSATFGEATLFAMLWHNGVIPQDHVGTDDRRWNYSHPATEGWGGDTFVPYTNGSASGYVFKSTWDSTEDAEQFHQAYLELLASKGATEVRDGVYRIPADNGFGDAFRVELDGDTVIVTNAPTVEQLDDVREES
jgi:hypothetical protein